MKIHKLKGSLSKTESNADDYLSQLRETKRELEEKQLELGRVKSNADRLGLDENKAQNEITKLKDREFNLTIQVDKLTKALDEIRKASIGLNDQLHESRKKYSELTAKMLDLETENKKLKEDIDNRKAGLSVSDIV